MWFDVGSWLDNDGRHDMTVDEAGFEKKDRSKCIESRLKEKVEAEVLNNWTNERSNECGCRCRPELKGKIKGVSCLSSSCHICHQFSIPVFSKS